MIYPYFKFYKFPLEITNQFCYYSINTRKKLLDEIYNISNALSDKIDKYWTNIEKKLKINEIMIGDIANRLKKSINQKIDKIDEEINNLLKSIWINCVLLYQIEALILPYPFFSCGQFV